MPSGHLQSPPHEPVPSAFSSTTLAGPKCPTKVGKMSACVHGSRHSSFRGLDLITIARLWTQSRYNRQVLYVLERKPRVVCGEMFLPVIRFGKVVAEPCTIQTIKVPNHYRVPTLAPLASQIYMDSGGSRDTPVQFCIVLSVLQGSESSRAPP